MSQNLDYLSKHFLLWIVANIIGFGFLGALLLMFPSIMAVSGVVATALIISIPISFAQWIALRRTAQVSPLWILTIPTGLLLSVAVWEAIPEDLWLTLDDESVAVLTALYLVLGFAIGLPQWLLLRQRFANASIWLLGSSLGVALGFWLILATDLVHQSGFLPYIGVILVYTTVTGLSLTGLLAYNNQPQTNLVSTTKPVTLKT